LANPRHHNARRRGRGPPGGPRRPPAVGQVCRPPAVQAVIGLRRMADKIITHWIDGKLHDRPADRHGDVFNPATGEVQARVAFASPGVVDEAVDAAARAAAGWRSVSIARRTKILFAFRQLVDRHQHELPRLLTLEHGKVTADALGEVNRGLEVIEFACGIADLAKGEYSENVSTEVDSYSIRQPLGVVAGITPFNFPAMVPMWMYPIALA